jgi:hypothetical protein
LQRGKSWLTTSGSSGEDGLEKKENQTSKGEDWEQFHE